MSISVVCPTCGCHFQAVDSSEIPAQVYQIGQVINFRGGSVKILSTKVNQCSHCHKPQLRTYQVEQIFHGRKTKRWLSQPRIWDLTHPSS